jgi:hypothetical protein
MKYTKIEGGHHYQCFYLTSCSLEKNQTFQALDKCQLSDRVCDKEEKLDSTGQVQQLGLLDIVDYMPFFFFF